MYDYRGKTAFITGAANGVGLGMATAFAKEGINVIMSDIRRDDLEKSAMEVKKYNKNVYTIVVDVSDRNAMKEAADEAEKAFGNIHILCNNAGINIFVPLDKATFDDWDWMFNVCFWGQVNGIMHFLPKIKAHGEGGHVVNTCSMAAFVTSHGTGIHSSIKAAIRGMSETLWYNLAPQDIWVSIVCPGFVNSKIGKTEELRPDKYSSGYNSGETRYLDMEDPEKFPGMSPLEVGERVLKGMKNRELFIFTHAEMKEELKENFDWILSYFPDEEINQKRKAFENNRRKANVEDRVKYDTRGKIIHKP
ncbi:MAG: SDR family NAD(P)-dependent oxidoreductase [Deltaproteobacteria bacterium]|nr:SDR family NAD(P)-dependent oxidoreductase [Deltaproteobacteria bacterium]